MLLGNFFKIEDLFLRENSVKVKINLEKEHSIYNGHFPEQAVVPGVCMVQMLVESLGHSLNKKLSLVKGQNIKFLNILDPNLNQNLFFDISFQETTAQQLKINGMLKSEETIFFKFKGILKQEA